MTNPLRLTCPSAAASLLRSIPALPSIAADSAFRSVVGFVIDHFLLLTPCAGIHARVAALQIPRAHLATVPLPTNSRRPSNCSILDNHRIRLCYRFQPKFIEQDPKQSVFGLRPLL